MIAISSESHILAKANDNAYVSNSLNILSSVSSNLSKESNLEISKTIVIELDYGNKNILKLQKFQEESDNQEEYLEKIRFYYEYNNSKIAKKLKLDSNELVISKYTPMIYIKSSMDDDYMEDLFVELSYSGYVKTIWLENSFVTFPAPPPGDECIIGPLGEEICDPTPPPPPPPDPDYRNVYYDNFPEGTQYRGENVRIGILDSGDLDLTHNNFANIDIYEVYDNTTGDLNPDHPNIVASIIGGKYGIADQASLYYADVNTEEGFFVIDRLLDRSVSIINMSIGNSDCEFGNNGILSQQAYILHIVKTYQVIVVASTGNFNNIDNSNSVVCTPANIAGVISVGSIDNSGRPSDFSSWDSSDSAFYRNNSDPTLSAVGENRYVNGFGYVDGTSFSAPAVTGTIALLIEKHGGMKVYNAMSILTATSNNGIINTNTQTVPMFKWVPVSPHSTDLQLISFGTEDFTNNYEQSIGHHERTGAGALDITAALAYNGSIVRSNLQNYSENDIIVLDDIYVTSGKEIVTSLAWERPGFWESDGITFNATLAGIENFDIVIRDSNDNIVAQTTGLVSNVEVLRYNVTATGWYRIEMHAITADDDYPVEQYSYTILTR